MRLRKFNGLVMVAVSSTLAGMTASISGCKHQAPPKEQHPSTMLPMAKQTVSPMMPAATGSSTEPTTAPATQAAEPTAIPTTSPTTVPANDAATPPVVAPVPAVPVPAPATVPATEPATAPTVVPAPVVAPVVVPAPTPVPTPATVPTTVPTVVTGGDHAADVTPTTLPATNPTTAPVVPPVAVVPPTKDAPPPTDDDEKAGDVALAERIASIAELSFPAKVSNNEAWPFLWQQQAALYSAATTLNPAESRYARLTADADAQSQDINGEIKALFAATKAKPDDEFSWNKRLDLLLSQIETGEAQVKYLRSVMDAKVVPPNVRAHAGFRSAEILLARGQDAAAGTVLEEALRYNPSSIECLKMRYSMLPATAPRFERVGRLLDLLKANPLQWEYAAQVAELTAGSGLIKQSIPWYNLAISCAHQQHNAAAGTALDMAAALYVSDRKTDAASVVSSLLDYDPKFYPAWFMQLVLARSSSDKDALAKTLQSADNALSNRVVEVVNQVAKSVTNQPTTRPLSSEGVYPLPDLPAVVTKLKTDGTPADKQLFIEAVADLARLDIYFAQKPDAAAPLLDALHGLLPDNDPLLAQLQGWSAVLANKPEEAKAKLTSIAAQDPLAQLGLVKLLLDNPDSREQAESIARKLVQDNPSGLVGAMIWEALRSARIKLMLTPQAISLGQEVAQFPPDRFLLAEKPVAIYSVHASPDYSGKYFGDALLAKVTIVNLTDGDLTIGDDGMIKPQLLFQVTAQTGGKPALFEAVDTLACPLVIKPHLYAEQMVRVDQSQMLSFLSNPDSTGQAFEISGVLFTNETANRLGGYPSTFTKTYYRLPTPVTPDKLQGTLASIASGAPAQKITALTQLELLVQKLQKVKNPNGGPNAAIAPLMDELHKAGSDTIPAVAAWATKCEFELSEGADRAGIMHDLVEDSDWRHRQLALALLSGVDESLQKQVLAKLVVDPQSSVRAEAIAAQGLMNTPDVAPTTAPTTAP